MRSRYSAFALARADYLLHTWHPDFRPAELQLDEPVCWIGLEILASEQQEQRAIVEFEATLLAAGQVSAMRERSQFVFQQGRWWYTRGEELPASISPWTPARNQDCPCGSGVKFKRCCGAGGKNRLPAPD